MPDESAHFVAQTADDLWGQRLQFHEFTLFGKPSRTHSLGRYELCLGPAFDSLCWRRKTTEPCRVKVSDLHLDDLPIVPWRPPGRADCQSSTGVVSHDLPGHEVSIEVRPYVGRRYCVAHIATLALYCLRHVGFGTTCVQRRKGVPPVIGLLPSKRQERIGSPAPSAYVESTAPSGRQ